MPKANDRIGPYQLIRKLGKGAFGEVWLAKNVAALVAVAATEVALKIPLDDDVDLDAIRQEASIWVAASGHANVLPILEASVYDEHLIIASEYAPDGSLKDWLKLYGGRAPSNEAAVQRHGMGLYKDISFKEWVIQECNRCGNVQYFTASGVPTHDVWG